MTDLSLAERPDTRDERNGRLVVSLRNVSKLFSNGTLALKDMSLDVERGEFLSLLGPSGCGKSTALRIIAGLGAPSSGTIDWPSSKINSRGLPEGDIGFVFQEPTLMPWDTVFGNVYLPLRLAGVSKAAAKPRIMETLRSVGLADFEHSYPRELSGGMKMRVSIARALVTHPKLLLMDEPFAALDEITRQKLNDDVLRLWRDTGITVIFVTHSVFESAFLSNRIVVMKARPGQVYRPADRNIGGARRQLPDVRGIPRDDRQSFPRAAGSHHAWSERTMSDAVQTAPADAGTDDAVQIAVARTSTTEKVLRVAVPLAMLVLAIGLWQFHVVVNEVPRYIMPSPVDVATALYTDWGTLAPSLLVTLRITFLALIIALIGGVGLAIILVQSKWIELAIFPFAVVLQVTPMIAIAPLLIIYLPTQTALLVCAFIVAFFPILSNMVAGLKSVDHNLLNLFELYGANRWQTLIYLKLPSSLPYFAAGLRIGGGLSLIAAVVAEFAAGSAGKGSGLAFRLLESGYRLNYPRLYAALILLMVTGVAIFAVTSLISWLLLHRWHESAVKREN